ncbi:paraquat-inducible protein A [Pseudooceanicola sp. LIPI14-2-Ac024]|uniref:paraquat-inducible protein A n=1 Tax=Pseudooceanicola sp. LIPI14-2-Ac024 TaxID=3344875 RepID=UPI0035D0326E
MQHAAAVTEDDLSHLIACPRCDALYHVVEPASRERAVCGRCHHVLIAPRRGAGMRLIAVSLTVVILVIAATIFPFLTIRVGGVSHSSSILEAAMSFRGGAYYALALAVAALIVFIPVLRALLMLYVLVPVVFDRPPARYARQAFRWSDDLRPWSMAEVFAIGCAVALVKVADLAEVQFGPAFWMFSVLVVLVVVQDTFMCRYSVWKALEE